MAWQLLTKNDLKLDIKKQYEKSEKIDEIESCFLNPRHPSSKGPSQKLVVTCKLEQTIDLKQKQDQCQGLR